MAFPLTLSDPSSLGLDPQALERLVEVIAGHITEGRYPGAQIAVARRGQLALFKSLGEARTEGTRGPARAGTRCPAWPESPAGL